MLQFFESADSSPRKRPKLEIEGEDCNDNDDHVGKVHESMPGLYEEDENGEERGFNAPDDEEENYISHDFNPRYHEQRPRPPASAPGPSRTSQSDLLFPTTRAKPISARQEGRASSTRYQECPICNKKLETDNGGLNAHIDFCLSRNVIMEAQTAAQSDPKNFVLSWPNTAKGKRKRKC
jgi:DNA polymerase kappa